MNLRFLNEKVISLLILLNFSRGLICSRIQRGEEEKRFIKCLESNSLTSCLILLFINEKQEKLLLQVQNELSK